MPAQVDGTRFSKLKSQLVICGASEMVLLVNRQKHLRESRILCELQGLNQHGTAETLPAEFRHDSEIRHLTRI